MPLVSCKKSCEALLRLSYSVRKSLAIPCRAARKSILGVEHPGIACIAGKKPAVQVSPRGHLVGEKGESQLRENSACQRGCNRIIFVSCQKQRIGRLRHKTPYQKLSHPSEPGPDPKNAACLEYPQAIAVGNWGVSPILRFMHTNGKHKTDERPHFPKHLPNNIETAISKFAVRNSLARSASPW
jgi:hypothetical protein